MGISYRRFGYTAKSTKCVNCGHCFWYGEMMFHSKHGYRNFICQQCLERENIPNIKITAEVDGKQVPLNTISTESFEAIKALEKPKEIPVARLTYYSDDTKEPHLLFRPTENIQLNIGRVYSLDLKCGIITGSWELENDEWAIKNTYHFASITIL